MGGWANEFMKDDVIIKTPNQPDLIFSKKEWNRLASKVGAKVAWAIALPILTHGIAFALGALWYWHIDRVIEAAFRDALK